MKLALIGCGGIARAHLACLREAGDELLAAVDVDLARAQAVADEYGGRALDSVEALLEGPRPDGVIIASPPNVHLANATPLLRAGIPVLCEKPLAHTLADAEALAALAAETGVPAFVAYCHRFNPAAQYLREAVVEGRLGHIFHFLNDFSGWVPDFLHAWRSDPAVAGGGAMMDNGSHSVDLFQFIFGPISEVHARLHYPPPWRADAAGSLMLLSESGVAGHVIVGFANAKGAAFFEAVGSEQALRYDYACSGETIESFRPGEGPEALPLSGGAGVRFPAQYAAFRAALRGQLSPVLCDFAQALEVSRVLHRCYHPA